MSALEHLIRYESPHSGIVFRPHLYGAGDDAGVVIDCLALANAELKGRRFVFLGVDEHGVEGRALIGVDKRELERFRRRFKRLMASHIEPLLNATVRAVEIDGHLIAYIRIKDCLSAPYLAKQDLGDMLRAGMGFIRRGATNYALQRSDMQRMFARSREAAAARPTVRVGFADAERMERLVLPALPVSKLPSELAAERLRSLLAAHSEAREIFGRTQTRFSRLMHAKIFGVDVPYRRRSDHSLVTALESVEADYDAADKHYLYEVRAHKLNFAVANDGDRNLHNASLRVTLPQTEGVGIADRVHTGDESEIGPDGYPKIVSSARTISLESELGTLYAGRNVRAFREPARLWARDEAAGRAVPVDYELDADELAEPLSGGLAIYIDRASLKSV